jgi:hypothetical protein
MYPGPQAYSAPQYYPPPQSSSAYGQDDRSFLPQASGSNGERGLGASLVGAGAGAFLGHEIKGGAVADIGGAIIGAIAANAFEKHEKKKRARRDAENYCGRRDHDVGSRSRGLDDDDGYGHEREREREYDDEYPAPRHHHHHHHHHHRDEYDDARDGYGRDGRNSGYYDEKADLRSEEFYGRRY